MLIKIIFHHELRTMIWLFCMFYCPKAVVTWMVHSMFKLYSFVPIPKWINSRVLFPFFSLFFKRDQFVLHTFAHSLSRRGFWCAFWSLWIVKTQLLVGWLSVCDFQQRSMHWEHSRMTDRQRGKERERENRGREWMVELAFGWDGLCSVLSLLPRGPVLYVQPLWAQRQEERWLRKGDGGRPRYLEWPGNRAEETDGGKSGRWKSNTKKWVLYPPDLTAQTALWVYWRAYNTADGLKWRLWKKKQHNLALNKWKHLIIGSKMLDSIHPGVLQPR